MVYFLSILRLNQKAWDDLARKKICLSKLPVCFNILTPPLPLKTAKKKVQMTFHDHKLLEDQTCNMLFLS